MNEANELLRRALKVLDKFCVDEDLQDDILNYLANQEPKKSIDGDQMLEGFSLAQDLNPDYRLSSFAAGVRFAEKHHGIKND